MGTFITHSFVPTCQKWLALKIGNVKASDVLTFTVAENLSELLILSEFWARFKRVKNEKYLDTILINTKCHY